MSLALHKSLILNPLTLYLLNIRAQFIYFQLSNNISWIHKEHSVIVCPTAVDVWNIFLKNSNVGEPFLAPNASYILKRLGALMWFTAQQYIFEHTNILEIISYNWYNHRYFLYKIYSCVYIQLARRLHIYNIIHPPQWTCDIQVLMAIKHRMIFC